jgi:hypothetical protein
MQAVLDAVGPLRAWIAAQSVVPEAEPEAEDTIELTPPPAEDTVPSDP